MEIKESRESWNRVPNGGGIGIDGGLNGCEGFV